MPRNFNANTVLSPDLNTPGDITIENISSFIRPLDVVKEQKSSAAKVTNESKTLANPSDTKASVNIAQAPKRNISESGFRKISLENLGAEFDWPINYGELTFAISKPRKVKTPKIKKDTTEKHTKPKKSTGSIEPIEPIELIELIEPKDNLAAEKATSKIRRRLGAVALFAALVPVGYFGAIAANSFVDSLNKSVKARQAAQSFVPQTPPSTTEAPTTTTTEVPPPPYEAEPGQTMATIWFPTLCNETVQVVEVSMQDANNAAIDNEGSTPMTPIDQRIPDPNPTPDCAQTLDYQKATGAITRAQWHKPSSQGSANQWEPIAGHAKGASVYPGQTGIPSLGEYGNSVIFGHGSTFSAPFSNIAALKPGDQIVVKRGDGQTFVYQFIETDVVPAPNPNDKASEDAFNEKLYNYGDPQGSFITLERCGYPNGNPGSAETRVLVRLGYVKQVI